MSLLKKPFLTGRRFRRRNLELPGDPFAQTKLDYAFNLLAAGIFRATRDDLRDMDLVLRLVEERGKLRTRAGRKIVASELTVPAFGRLALAVARSEGSDLRVPNPPQAPVSANLDLLATTLALSEVDKDVLQFALACRERDMRILLDPVSCESSRELVVVVAAAIARSSVDVATALGAKGRLVSMGLLTINDNGDVDDRLEVDPRLLNVLPVDGLGTEGLLERFVPLAAPTTLERADYAHLVTEVEMAVRVLRGALRAARSGVNVLLHGPTGTGKTELGRLLAAEVGVPLFIAGRADDDGNSPTASERLTSLKLGNKIVKPGHGLLLFDEMEDLFDANTMVRIAGGRRDEGRMSKQWFNLLLEENPVPTIWISNDVDGVDPAYLRRFSFVLEVGALTTSGRRRAWLKHLGTGHALAANDVDALARTFEVSPAQIGGAVTTGRLACEGAVDRPTLEAVLRSTERVLRGRKVEAPAFDPGRYRPEVVNTPVDLDEVARQLAEWRPGRGVGLSLCLYGPPGTGKSAYVHHLAHRMDRPLVVRRASDLLSCWVGESEKNIAKAFERAKDEDALLLFDEVDSFLRDRRQAARSWEVTETNEFLQQLEAFSGVVACTTNLLHAMDQAALRRFTFKIPFLFMRPEQAVALFRWTLADLGGEVEEGGAAEAALVRVANLTPGDFAAAARRVRALRATPTAQGFVAELMTEVRVKESAGARIGF